MLVELDSSVERAELAQAQAQQALARSNFERAKELRRNNAGTQRALDEADAALRTANARSTSPRRGWTSASSWPRSTRAPGLRNVSPGDYVTEGTEIVNLEQIDPLKVDFRVPELFLPAVAPGQRITVAIDAYPRRSLHRRGEGAQPADRRRPGAPSWCAPRSTTTRASCGRACSRGCG